MKEIVKVFNIAPQSASRPIVSKYGVRYSKRYMEWKKDFAKLVGTSMGSEYALNGALTITIFFYMPIPKSWSKKKQIETHSRPHTSKPDIDNLAKAVLDGISGRYFRDDSQVYSLHCMKYWSNNPRISVIMKEV